ncbi:MAG: hypothetical protein KDI82_02890 [Gammaproteobacteria bacterium]|nr:hypothetical protein [Gammaproteobacteria bacterium]
MKSMRLIFTCLSAAAVSGLAAPLVLAHPGHGVLGHGDDSLHPLFSGEHLLLMTVIGIGALLLRRHLGGGRHDGE